MSPIYGSVSIFLDKAGGQLDIALDRGLSAQPVVCRFSMVSDLERF